MTPEYVLSHLPEDVLDNYQGFAKFISDYYLWNQEVGFNAQVNNLRELIEQKAYNKSFEDRVTTSLGVDVNIIESSKVQTELLYKLIDQFLETRGSKTSFEILFRMMFNEQVKIEYPRDKLFKPSAAKFLQTSLILMSGDRQLSTSYSITGLRSQTITGIESFVPFYIGQDRYYIVHCSNNIDEFIPGEPLEIMTLSSTYNEVHIPVINIDIKDPGLLYKRGDVITPSSNVLAGHFVVSNVSKGTIEGIDIVESGIGYKVGELIHTVPRSHVTGVISEVSADGVVLKVDLTCGGYNLTELPVLEVNTESGSGIKLQPVTTTIGKITEVSSVGVVYSTGNITYTISSDAGTGAVLKSKLATCYKRYRYINDAGVLGRSSILLDSYTKHSHSYDIISEVPGVKYNAVVKKYANPSGQYYNMIYKKVSELELRKLEITSELIRK